MPQSLAIVTTHIIFSTKKRRPWLQDLDIRRELYAYMATVLNALDSPPIIINGVSDHVHILCLLSRHYTIKKILEDIKKKPSRWIKTKGSEYCDFYWQGGYGIFSVSESRIAEMKSYIQNQEEHHKKFSFQEEFRKICEQHGIVIDERYVWD